MINEPSAQSGTLVHIGGPTSAQITDYEMVGAERLILVVPNPEKAARLQREMANKSGVKVFHGSVATSEREAYLRCWNLSSLDSIVEPTSELHDLYPSLRLRVIKPIPLINPKDLMDRIGGSTPPLRLAIDTPGSELSILAAWDEAGLIEEVSLLTLRVPEAVLFEGSAPREEVEKWLITKGFVVIDRNLDDPDWPTLSLRADPMERKLIKVQAAREAAENRVAELAKAHDDARNQAEAQSKALEQAENRIAQLESSIQRANAAQNASENRIQELERMLSDAQSKAQAYNDAATARDAAEGRIAEMNKKCGIAQAQADAERKARDEAEQKREKALEDLSMATRLQGLLQADLNDLRARFARSEEARIRQEALLRDLTPRLQEAAKQLHGMRLQEDSASPEQITAPKGSREKKANSKGAKSKRVKKASHATSDRR